MYAPPAVTSTSAAAKPQNNAEQQQQLNDSSNYIITRIQRRNVRGHRIYKEKDSRMLSRMFFTVYCIMY